MLIGFEIPIAGDLATPQTMLRLAIEGEAMGYGYAAISDHIVIPRDINARYPYSAAGDYPGARRAERHEQLTTAAFIAARTTRLRLLTSIMVVPYRQAMLAAKMLATIDVMSGGRLTVGCGAGWMEEEFRAVGAPPFAARGAVTDEYLQAFRALWTEENPSFSGRYVSFKDLVFAPKPVQKPHPPLWVGGESPPALRRAARLGDGWYPIGSNPQHPLDTLERYRAAVTELRRLAAAAGRDPAGLALGYRCMNHGRAPGGAGAERRLFAGPPEAVAEDLRALAALGVGSVDLSFAGATAEATIDAMRRFQDEVVALL